MNFHLELKPESEREAFKLRDERYRRGRMEELRLLKAAFGMVRRRGEELSWDCLESILQAEEQRLISEIAKSDELP